MTKRKANIVFGLILTIFIIGFIISYFTFSDFIGDKEHDIFDIVPKKVLLIFSILVCILIVYLQYRFKIIHSGFVVNFLPIKILASLIIYPFISLIISFMILFNVYSFSNYLFIFENVRLTGDVYKKEIFEVKRGADKYYICFNDTFKFKVKVSIEKYHTYNIGDNVSFDVVKGRFYGYYLRD